MWHGRRCNHPSAVNWQGLRLAGSPAAVILDGRNYSEVFFHLSRVFSEAKSHKVVGFNFFLNICVCFNSDYFLLQIYLKFWNWIWTLTKELIFSHVYTVFYHCFKNKKWRTVPWDTGWECRKCNLLNLFLTTPNAFMLLSFFDQDHLILYEKKGWFFLMCYRTQR